MVGSATIATARHVQGQNQLARSGQVWGGAWRGHVASVPRGMRGRGREAPGGPCGGTPAAVRERSGRRPIAPGPASGRGRGPAVCRLGKQPGAQTPPRPAAGASRPAPSAAPSTALGAPPCARRTANVYLPKNYNPSNWAPMWCAPAPDRARARRRAPAGSRRRRRRRLRPGRRWPTQAAPAAAAAAAATGAASRPSHPPCCTPPPHTPRIQLHGVFWNAMGNIQQQARPGEGGGAPQQGTRG
jgi:hypothetical protein